MVTGTASIANIIKNAFDEVGNDGDAIKNWLNAMPSYDGIAGATSFDSNGDSTILPSLVEIQDGNMVFVK